MKKIILALSLLALPFVASSAFAVGTTLSGGPYAGWTIDSVQTDGEGDMMATLSNGGNVFVYVQTGGTSI